MILVVDDDPLQAYVAVSLLERQYGDVRRATGAADALCLIEQPEFANKLTLVVSGRSANGIDGPAFVAELSARKPNLPILVLGMPGESPSDYPGEHIAFLPRPVEAHKMLALAGVMMSLNKNPVA
jgi:DNA-binding NtrC family response regulator